MVIKNDFELSIKNDHNLNVCLQHKIAVYLFDNCGKFKKEYGVHLAIYQFTYTII